MEVNKQNERRVVAGRSLIDIVFSWSFKDVLNQKMYQNQVKQIPKTFSSIEEYLDSFVTPLIAETHADLSSSTGTLSGSLCREIKSVRPAKDYKLPKDLFYSVVLHRANNGNESKKASCYEPENGDLIAITGSRPKCAGDLARPYLVAMVLRVNDDLITLSVLSSQPIFPSGGERLDKKEKREAFFAVYLLNMTTNIRIWQALNSDPKERNVSVMAKILRRDEFIEGDCTMCGAENSEERARIRASDLNESQRDAVLSCISAGECHHRSTVKLVWGPPGTGKTKTVGFALHSLLRMKCRTLTCAPTNVAVVQVAKRLVKSVMDSAKFGTYGLGDVVLFGNGERMKIDDHDELCEVFLNYRIEILYRCLAPKSGWRDSLISMINLLEDPEEQYRLYLKEIESKESLDEDEDGDSDGNGAANNAGNSENHDKDDNREDEEAKKGKNVLKAMIVRTMKENKKIQRKMRDKKKEKREKQDGKKGDKDSLSRNEEDGEEEKKHVKPQSFEEFVIKRFNCVAERLCICAVNLYTHLPSSLIPLETAEMMKVALDTLNSFRTSLQDVVDQGLLKRVSEEDGKTRESGWFRGFETMRGTVILQLKSLPSNFVRAPPSSSNHTDTKNMRDLILAKACLIFCTVSSSAKLKGTFPLELLIIDEAAQLKECESTIPLQLSGIRHTVLIGDERQLPAMVMSKVCEKAGFGRSLFERLASLGHKKRLLNVQHRMHPSISLFPNKEFYENKILDGQNVKLRSYCKRFLPGKMFGSYSFINVAHGREAVDDKRSSRNFIEVAVVSEIVASLYKEVQCSKKRVRVGVISPYKAQVHAIIEALGGKYSSDAKSDFSVSIRSVDGFQGGEEDVIIISTVRSNGTGYVGFLSNFQRANVAITRARHCLWIVGNGATLSSSSSVWRRLVIDAKQRDCFHNAGDDKNLAQAIAIALIEQNQINALPNLVSFLSKEAKWKVVFSDAFWRSMASVKDNDLRKDVLSLLVKLSCGWRQPRTESNLLSNNNAAWSQSVECYRVKQLCLVWAVDILRENSHHVQVLRIWDVLALADVPKLSKQLDVLYGSYTLDDMSRCKYRREERDLVVPMRWPVETRLGGADPVHFLSKTLASLSLKDQLGTSSAKKKKKKTKNQKISQVRKS